MIIHGMRVRIKPFTSSALVVANTFSYQSTLLYIDLPVPEEQAESKSLSPSLVAVSVKSPET